MPLRRATTETLCPGSRLSRTMANFCSGLQRRRRSWPKSSPLLSLLLVINITVCLSLIVRGKRCPVFHGARSEAVRDTLKGVIDRESNDRISFQEWNGDYMAGLLAHGVLQHQHVSKGLQSRF